MSGSVPRYLSASGTRPCTETIVGRSDQDLDLVTGGLHRVQQFRNVLVAPRFEVEFDLGGVDRDVLGGTRQSRQAGFTGLLPPDALDWGTGVSEGFRQFIDDIRSHDERALLVAARDNQVTGVAELVWAPGETSDFIEAEEAELVAVHVHSDRWNQGIGTRLLTEALTRLPPHLTSIALCVLSGNERARMFYGGRGFDRAGATVTTYAGKEREEAVYRRPL